MMKLVSLAGLVVLGICALGLQRSDAAVPDCYNGAAASVQFTQYWIPREGSNDVDDDGNVISLSGPQTENIVQDDGTLIESTDENTYNKCVEEGTCFLLNGDLVNLAVMDARFQILDQSVSPFGLGASGVALAPFVSVAANDLDPGTTLLVSELQNVQLPNGQTHNGCVRVDDTGKGFTCHIDWFVESYDNEVKLSGGLPEQATVQGTTLFVSELQNLQLLSGQTHNGCVRVDNTGKDFTCHIDWFVQWFNNEVSLNALPLLDNATVRSSQQLLDS